MTPAKKERDSVRMQIPMTKQLADEITGLAAKCHISQRKMAGIILDEFVGHRKNIAEDFGGYFMRAVSETLRVLTGKGRRPGLDKAESSHLDVEVKAETAEFVEALAETLGHTPARMAGQMLRWGVMESEHAIRLVTVPMLAVRDALRGEKKSGSIERQSKKTTRRLDEPT